LAEENVSKITHFISSWTLDLNQSLTQQRALRCPFLFIVFSTGQVYRMLAYLSISTLSRWRRHMLQRVPRGNIACKLINNLIAQ